MTSMLLFCHSWEIYETAITFFGYNSKIQWVPWKTIERSFTVHRKVLVMKQNWMIWNDGNMNDLSTTYRTDWNGSKSEHPPYTQLQPEPLGQIAFFFLRVAPNMNCFGRTKAIFQFHPVNWDMGTFWGLRVVKLWFKNWRFSAHNSAFWMKFKNRLGT